MLGKCSRCKQKKEIRKVHSFRLCNDCWKKAPKVVKESYPVW